MLTDDDKKWIASQICGNHLRASLAGYEDRIMARLDKFEATLVTEFRSWALPEKDEARINPSALQTLDLEMEALQGRVDKLENKGS